MGRAGAGAGVVGAGPRPAGPERRDPPRQRPRRRRPDAARGRPRPLAVALPGDALHGDAPRAALAAAGDRLGGEPDHARQRRDRRLRAADRSRSSLLAWRAFGPGVAGWSLVPLAFASTGTLWLSGRITGGHLLTAAWHAGAFALLHEAWSRGGGERAAALGLWCGLGLYLDSMFLITLAGLVPAASLGWWASGPIVARARVRRWSSRSPSLAGAWPREVGRRVEPHDAYREQFRPVVDRRRPGRARAAPRAGMPAAADRGASPPRLAGRPRPEGPGGARADRARGPTTHPAALAVDGRRARPLRGVAGRRWPRRGRRPSPATAVRLGPARLGGGGRRRVRR